ncbi:MAG: GHKL domain-containing protein [bacterium]|nr:GHKL domain-containing protein [bacterium]
MSALPILLAVNLMEYWILMLLIQDVCAAHIRFSRRTAIISSALSLFGTFLAVLFYTDYSFLFSMISAIAVTILLFSQKRTTDLLRFFPALAIYFLLTIAPEALLDAVIPASHIEIVFHKYDSTLVSLTTDVLLFAVLLFLHYLLRKYRITLHFRAREILGSIALFFFAFIDVFLVMWLKRSHLSVAWYCFYLALFIGAFVFSTGYFLYSLFESRIRISRQMLAVSEAAYLQMQLDSLQDVKENEEQVHRMRHDLASHLAVIRSLCDEGHYEEVKSYTEQLGHSTVFSAGRILTGNQIADLVIGSKKKAAEAHGIPFTFEGSLGPLSNMTAPDICGLLSNAYDNAIEACLALADTADTGETHSALADAVNGVNASPLPADATDADETRSAHADAANGVNASPLPADTTDAGETRSAHADAANGVNASPLPADTTDAGETRSAHADAVNAYIRTYAQTTRNYTAIRICNPVQKKAAIHGNRIATTKPDKKAHGCGIEIMKQITANYHGSCTVNCSDTEFELKIILMR